MANRKSCNCDGLTRDISETDTMYRIHQAAMFPQFNAYRVDLDIVLIEHRGEVIAYDDGNPLALIALKDISSNKWIEEVKKLFMPLRCDFGLACKFLSHSMGDRTESEKAADASADPWVNYVAIRKEIGEDGAVRRRLWYDRYNPRGAANWPYYAPILDVNNNTLDTRNVGTLYNRYPIPAMITSPCMPPLPPHGVPICGGPYGNNEE